MKAQMYVSLQEATHKLNKNPFEVLRAVMKSSMEHHFGEGQVWISLDDIFDYQWRQFQLEELPRSKVTLLPLIEYLTEKCEEESCDGEEYNAAKRIGQLLATLGEEDEQLLRDLALEAGDGFYTRVQESHPWLLAEAMPTSLYDNCKENDQEGKYRRARQTDPKTITKPITKRALKRQAQQIVKKVSDYFDIELPEMIVMSEERDTYASIRYRQQGLFRPAYAPDVSAMFLPAYPASSTDNHKEVAA